MRISFERTGGFAGLQLSAIFDLDELDEEDAKKIRDIIDETDFFELPDAFESMEDYPDQYCYTIKVETQDSTKVVTTGDASAPDDLQELIRLLNRLMRKRKKH